MLEIKHETNELIAHGVSTCAGCGLEIAIRTVIGELGEDTIVIIPPGCAATFSGCNNETVTKIPGYQGNLTNTAAVASGIRAALNRKGNDHTHVLAFAGDGGTVDIGMQALSGMWERQDKVIYVCYDNEAYMNTGIQCSGSTPHFASTTTTPAGKKTPRKDLGMIAIAHNIPYVATASVHDLNDLKKKVAIAKTIDGPSLIHIFAPCPTGWRSNPAKTIEIARKATQSGCWLLYEYHDGKVKLGAQPKELLPIREYTSLQGRFKKATEEELDELQQEVQKSYKRTVRKLELLNEIEE